jgi:hypothetical protein
MELANRATGNVRVKRLRRTLLPVGLLLVSQTVNQFRNDAQRDSPALAISVFVQQLLQVAANLALLLYNNVPQDVAVYCISTALKRLRSERPERVHPTSIFISQQSDSGIGKETNARRRTVGPLGQTDHTMNALLLAQLILWLPRVLTETPILVMVLVYLCRVLAAGVMVAMMMRGGEGATFEDLADGAGFGLVVRAAHLRLALEDATAGRRLAERRIPRFRATLYKMQHTMAVSYRWQAAEAAIAPGMSLNMSRFQIAGLLTAIRHSGCKYVWLDKLSVPQEECALKYTLLARMMAIYAAASSTVAIRTLE